MFNETVSTFIGRFRDHRVKPEMVEYIRSLCTKTPGGRPRRNEQNDGMRTVWLAVGFHPLIYGPLR
eukprot:5592896-Lingulodinium_polyedra.AAC.1